MSQEVLQYRVAAHTIDRTCSSTWIKETEIVFDSSNGQSATLPGPAELLCLAFAACVLKNVARFSQMLPFRYDEASIEVTAERTAAPPRIARLRYVLRLQTDEPARRVDLLHQNIRKHGTIYNTLAASCAVDGEIVVAGQVTDTV